MTVGDDQAGQRTARRSDLAYFIVADIRRRARSVLALALVVTVLGGVVLATAAGSRRTSTAVDRFLDRTSTREISLQIDVADDLDDVVHSVTSLDIVASWGSLQIMPILLQGGDAWIDELDLQLAASPDMWSTGIDRPLVLSGRMPDPTNPHEVIINELARAQLRAGIGDRLVAATFTPEDLDAARSGRAFEGFNGPEVHLEIVGIGRQAADLSGLDVAAGAMVIGTPALVADLGDDVGALRGLVGIRLRDGASIADYRDVVRPLLGDAEYEIMSADDEFADNARNTGRVLAHALLALAAVAAAATAVAVGGMLTRQAAEGADAAPVLAAMGWTRREERIAVGAAPFAGVILGALGAGIAAGVASTVFPIGVARRFEPDPGIRLDAVVLASGVALIAFAGTSWLVFRGQRRSPRTRVRRVGAWAALSTTLPTAMAIGVNHAVDGRAGDRSVPVRAALATATIAVVGIVASATIVRSLDGLYDAPQRYGWSWTSEPDAYTEDLDEVAGLIAREHGVSAVGIRNTARVEVDGVVSTGYAVDVLSGSIDPVIRSGRWPATANEVALGSHTADDLGVAVGDLVSIREAHGEGHSDVRVVGSAVFAPVESTDPAQGVLLTVDGLERFRRSDGYRSLLLRYDEDRRREVDARLVEKYPVDFSLYSEPRAPGSLENLQHITPLIGGLAAFFAGLGLVAVGHALVVGVRRRGRELATLGALGLSRRQVRSIVTWNATATLAVAVVTGVPLGVVVGRLVWRLVIGDLGVIDTPTTPWLVLFAVTPAAMTAAVVLSWWPGRRASHVRPTHLRAE